MKKVILTVALFIGTVAFANAQFTVINDSDNTEIVAQEDWKEVKLEDLNENVQSAVAALVEENELKSLAYNEATGHTKVTVATEDGTECVVILNEEGNEVE